MSKKRSKLNVEYSRLRKDFLEAHPYCQVTIQNMGVTEEEVIRGGGTTVIRGDLAYFPRSVDVHHMKRRGKYFLDTSSWLAVSRQAHDWIHSNPKEATEMGWLIPRSQENLTNDASCKDNQ